ncbi:MAG TPA: hypothetical protein VIE43_26335 [Thermoanaerobaculia bacterium]|jgi:hypothetical protein|nr:hypothetical protein [Thermoanaerobaculia bacterium]
MSEILSEPPELAAARKAREAQDALAAEGAQPRSIPPPAIPDPLSLCVYTTVALLAWIFTPALAAAVCGAVACHAYWRSWRAGLRRSDCILRDPRLVMLYLGLVAVAGAAWTVLRVVRWLHRF